MICGISICLSCLIWFVKSYFLNLYIFFCMWKISYVLSWNIIKQLKFYHIVLYPFFLLHMMWVEIMSEAFSEKFCKMVSKMYSRVAGSTPPSGSSKMYKSASRDITKISCSFSCIPLLILEIFMLFSKSKSARGLNSSSV